MDTNISFIRGIWNHLLYFLFFFLTPVVYYMVVSMLRWSCYKESWWIFYFCIWFSIGYSLGDTFFFVVLSIASKTKDPIRSYILSMYNIYIHYTYWREGGGKNRIPGLININNIFMQHIGNFHTWCASKNIIIHKCVSKNKLLNFYSRVFVLYRYMQRACYTFGIQDLWFYDGCFIKIQIVHNVCMYVLYALNKIHTNIIFSFKYD